MFQNDRQAVRAIGPPLSAQVPYCKIRIHFAANQEAHEMSAAGSPFVLHAIPPPFIRSLLAHLCLVTMAMFCSRQVAGNYAADMLPNMLAKQEGYPIGLYLDAKTNTLVEVCCVAKCRPWFLVYFFFAALLFLMFQETWSLLSL